MLSRKHDIPIYATDGTWQAGGGLGEARVGGDDVVGGVDARVVAEDDVQGPAHGPEVDALGGGPALAVREIALERFPEEGPRAGAVGPREHPGVHDPAERRSVGGAAGSYNFV